jgi:hypothetical protein
VEAGGHLPKLFQILLLLRGLAFGQVPLQVLHRRRLLLQFLFQRLVVRQHGSQCPRRLGLALLRHLEVDAGLLPLTAHGQQPRLDGLRLLKGVLQGRHLCLSFAQGRVHTHDLPLDRCPGRCVTHLTQQLPQLHVLAKEAFLVGVARGHLVLQGPHLPLERAEVKGGGEGSEGRGRAEVPLEGGEVGEHLLEGTLCPGTEAAQALKGSDGDGKARGTRRGRGRRGKRRGVVMAEGGGRRGGRGGKGSLVGCRGGRRRRRRGTA